MAKISQEEMLEAIASMSVMEIADLIKAMEEKFGVTAAAAVVAAGPQAAGDAAGAAGAEEQTEFTVFMKSADPAKKIAAIKEVRAITGLGLKDAKDLVENPAGGNIKEGVSKDEATKIKAQLEAAGCVIEIK